MAKYNNLTFFKVVVLIANKIGIKNIEHYYSQMGSRLCCMEASTSPSHMKKNVRERTRAVSNLSANTSKNVVVRYKQEDGRKSVRRTLTLKECLLASPNNHHHAIIPSKIQVYTSDLTPSPQITRSAEIKTEEGSSFAHMLDHCGNRKPKKKVSFRFPEEADIFIFCSE